MASHIQAVLFCAFLWAVQEALLRLDASIPQCCTAGTYWAREGQECDRYPSPVLAVVDADQEACLSTILLCCEKTKRAQTCDKAVKEFENTKNCQAKNETCGDLELKCCEGCKLGVHVGEAKIECSKIEMDVEEEVKKVFQGCCVRANPNSDYKEDYDEYGIPTPAVDNLCDLLPGQLCAQICVPTPGSYYCKCNKGFTLMEDQKTCQQDKKRPRPSTFSPPVIVPNPEKPVPLHKPRNNPDTPQPNPNSVTSKQTCTEGNPCEQECLDTDQGIKCACRPGFEIDVDRKSCNDIDECLDNVHVCDPEMELCINEIGAYRCVARGNTITPATTAVTKPPGPVCTAGYEPGPTGECVDINECDYEKNPEACEPNQVCANFIGSYECRCKEGFHKEQGSSQSCVDINECQTRQHNCLPSQRCDNTIGSFQCIRFTGCGTGYTLNAQSGLCEDDDECAFGNDNCRFLGPNYQCRNTLGSFRCERKKCNPGDKNCTDNTHCPVGYHEDHAGHCTDTDECQLGTHNCNPLSEQCMNRAGGFECRKLHQCPKGFEAHSSPLSWGTQITCVDVNECATNKHDCKGLAECRNHNGGYTCACPLGFQLEGNNSCEDQDECDLYLCPFNSDCQNTPGSYRCVCKGGFRNVDNNSCEDQDECAMTPGICDHNCINVFGSYRCTCRVGFRLHENNRTCVDLDECDMFKDQRLCIGECVNTPGSFSCRCPPGYVLGTDGRTCQDVDECLKGPCRGQDEVCLNTRGSFRCNSIKCPPDYVKDPEHKNRCKRSKAYCREGDMNCLQRPLTYSFNFITFVSMLPIPPSGHLDLFTMRGPLWSGTESQFSLDLLSARVPSNIIPATKDYFRLRNSGWNQAVIALVRPIPGPQELELQLTMNLYHNGHFGGVGVAKLFIHVSQYEF